MIGLFVLHIYNGHSEWLVCSTHALLDNDMKMWQYNMNIIKEGNLLLIRLQWQFDCNLVGYCHYLIISFERCWPLASGYTDPKSLARLTHNMYCYLFLFWLGCTLCAAGQAFYGLIKEDNKCVKAILFFCLFLCNY